MFILGVKVDNISKDEALERVEGWLESSKGKHYITTPNLEFIKDAQTDPEFKKILNEADLAIPDSSHLGWLKKITDGQVIHFEVVPGVDLMDGLCQLASEKGFAVGLLGAGPGVAEKATECLKKKYPKLKVSFASGDINVNNESRIMNNGEKAKNHNSYFIIHNSLPPTDLLFVAFGHRKQEKWIAENLDKIPVKVAMGVGGAFDYISGNVPRAPRWMRSMGMEWLFRLIVQPWRIKRQASLAWFLFSLLFKKTNK